MVNAQQWLEYKYPTQQSKEDVIKLEISPSSIDKLEGTLILMNFTKLEELDCRSNYITFLEIINCPNLKVINLYNNQLTELKLGKLEKLTDLVCNINQLNNLDITGCPNLKNLDCSRNLLVDLDLR